MAAPLFDTNLKIAMYIICYLLFIGVILAIGISLCMYIDHRRQARLSRAALDVEGSLMEWKDKERNSSEGKDAERNLSEGKDEENLSEGKDEETPLLPSQPQSHQDQNGQLIPDPQWCTYVNEKSSLSSKYGAINPLRVSDKRSKLEYRVNKPATFPRCSATKSTAHVPKHFTKYGMRCNETKWNSELGRWTSGGIVFPSRARRAEELDVVIGHM